MMSYEELDEYSGVNEAHAPVKYTNALCHLRLLTLYNSQFIILLPYPSSSALAYGYLQMTLHSS